MKIIKSILKSKTIWFGHVLTMLGIIEANMGLIQNNLGNAYGYVFIGVAIVTYALRAVTNESLGSK